MIKILEEDKSFQDNFFNTVWLKNDYGFTLKGDMVEVIRGVIAHFSVNFKFTDKCSIVRFSIKSGLGVIVQIDM